MVITVWWLSHGPMDSGTTSNGVPHEPMPEQPWRAKVEPELDEPPETGLPESEPVSSVATLFREQFEQFLPTIQREWPEVARHTLEATRGSLDTVVEVIARQTGRTSDGVKDQLLDLLTLGEDQAQQWADSLRPLEEQLEQLLDDLNTNLRPRIEKPVRERPLMALGLAAGVGLLLGLMLSGRRSS